mmetsp:Transcript_6905/g.17666  ORF Transcript_6905/g.17666 Transcript_6905/m.17666 type:complete len:235 (-) Transcript_6905:189-893(-)
MSCCAIFYAALLWMSSSLALTSARRRGLGRARLAQEVDQAEGVCCVERRRVDSRAGEHGVGPGELATHQLELLVTDHVGDIIARLERVFNGHALVELPGILAGFALLGNDRHIANADDVATPIKSKRDGPEEVQQELPNRGGIAARIAAELVHGVGTRRRAGKAVALRVAIKVRVVLLAVLAWDQHDRQVHVLLHGAPLPVRWERLQRRQNGNPQLLKEVDQNEEIAVARKSTL